MLIMDQLTHHGLAKLAKQYGGLFHLRMGNINMVTVSSPEIAKQVLKSQDNIFSNRPTNIAINYLTYDRSDMAFANYGPFWRQMRKISVMKLFSRRRAESWESVRDEIDSMVQTVAANPTGNPINVGELIFTFTMNLTYRAAFGTSNNNKGQMEEFIKILQEFSRLFELTKDNIKAIIMDVMFGGTETVASVIEWAMAELLKSPDDLKRVQQELSNVVGLNRHVEERDLDKLTFLKCILKETLLLHETAEDTEVSGYFIPKRSRVMVNAYAIARDPNSWVNPNEFNPARFLKEGMPDFKGE
ncbi:Cytochrome P450 84A1 [Linum perenne]